jgi:hypothetical protein
VGQHRSYSGLLHCTSRGTIDVTDEILLSRLPVSSASSRGSMPRTNISIKLHEVQTFFVYIFSAIGMRFLIFANSKAQAHYGWKTKSSENYVTLT